MNKKNTFAKKLGDAPEDCLNNHLPKWVEDSRITHLIREAPDQTDRNNLFALMNEYSQIETFEEKNKDDAFTLYGTEVQKAEIAEKILAIYDKYRQIVKQPVEKIAEFFYPDDKEKRLIWSSGYNWATTVFSPLSKVHHQNL